MREALHEAASHGVNDQPDHDRNGACFPQERSHNRSGAGDNDLTLPVNQLLRGGLDATGFAARPGIIDLQVTAFDPPQLLKSLLEAPHFGSTLGVIRIKRHQHAYPPHPFWLLRLRREWPRDRRTTEKRDKHAPSHAGPQTQETAY